MPGWRNIGRGAAGNGCHHPQPCRPDADLPAQAGNIGTCKGEQLNRLSQEQAALIRDRVNAGPSAEERIAAYREALWSYECWVAALELKLVHHGIDPSLEEL